MAEDNEMNTPHRTVLSALTLAMSLLFSMTNAVAAEPTKPATSAAPAKPAAKNAAANPNDTMPIPRRSPYAQAARDNAEAGNGVVGQVQGDGKLATARKSVPRDQAQSAALHAKSVQRRGAH